MKAISKVFVGGLLLGTALLHSVSGSADAVKTANTGLMIYNAAQATKQAARLAMTFTKLSEKIGAATIFVGLWNFDVPSIAVDIYVYIDNKKKTAKLSEDIPELTAAVREIGDGEALEDDIAEKMFDPQEVEILTLKNVGLEALKGVDGDTVPVSLTEILSSTGAIQTGFGTMTGGVPSSVITSVCGQLTGALRTQCEDSAAATNSGQTATINSTQRQEHTKRRLAHLQMTGTAGVTRADMATALVAAGREDEDTLISYIGGGSDLVGNAKVLAGLDLILAQRLNLLNMIQGQQAANDAAMALQYVHE